MSDQPLTLPEGARLLHIGPYKTGSTAIQAALWNARPQLQEHGAAYPGKDRRAMRPGWAVLGRRPRGRRTPQIEEWEEFAREVEGLGPLRVCVSSEDFGRASQAQADRVVRDLGGERVHVLSAVRRLDKLLPSQWQERVKNYERRSYTEWLEAVLLDEQSPAAVRFWGSHDLERVLERWSKAAGAANLVLVVLDESDRSLLPRTFERLLGLPQGLLRTESTGSANSSLNGNGAELMRSLNDLFAERGWPDRAYHRLIQRGLVLKMREAARSPHDVPIPQLPDWAAERVAGLNERRAAAVRSSGAVVVGDPDRLTVPLPRVPGADAPAEVLPMPMAVSAIEGVVEAALSRPGPRQVAAPAPGPVGRRVDDMSGRELLQAAGQRALRRFRARG